METTKSPGDANRFAPVEQYWAHDDLPSKGEREMAGWLVADSRILANTVPEVWKGKAVKVPIVIGMCSISINEKRVCFAKCLEETKMYIYTFFFRVGSTGRSE